MKRTPVGRLRQLAMTWQQRSVEDECAAVQPAMSPVADSLRAWAKVRRNCASELLMTLQALDKENPAKAGLVSVPHSDHQSE